jgi:hypothetical protein
MRWFAIFVATFIVAGCEPKSPTSAPTPVPVAAPAPPRDPETNLAPETKKRIADLVAISEALAAYKAAKGTYPVSGGKWASYKMSWGLSKGEAWIPELVPEFLAALPRDPAKSEDADGPQYLYYSDGSVFKLVAHNAPDCDKAIKSPRVKKDPGRVRPDGTCWSFGIWTEGGEGY